MSSTIAPAVSVVIPAYQCASTLPRAVNSVLAQDFQDFEIIIVNDGSTDSTAAVAEELCRASPRITLIHQENQGPSVARNNGIAVAAGEWIAFLDADDEWLPHKLRDQMRVLQNIPSVDLLLTDSININLETNSVASFSVLHDRYLRQLQFIPQSDMGKVSVIEHNSLRAVLAERNFLLPSTVVLRKAAFLRAGGFDPQWRGPEDWDLWRRLLREDVIFAYLDNVTVNRFFDSTSLSWPDERKLREMVRFHTYYLNLPGFDEFREVTRNKLFQAYRALILHYNRNRQFHMTAKTLSETFNHGVNLRTVLFSLVTAIKPSLFEPRDNKKLAQEATNSIDRLNEPQCKQK